MNIAPDRGQKMSNMRKLGKVYSMTNISDVKNEEYLSIKERFGRKNSATVREMNLKAFSNPTSLNLDQERSFKNKQSEEEKFNTLIKNSSEKKPLKKLEIFEIAEEGLELAPDTGKALFSVLKKLDTIFLRN